MEARLPEYGPALLNVGPLKPHHHRQFQSHLFCCLHHTIRHPVTSQDAAKNIDQHHLDILISQQNSQCIFHLFGRRSTANVEEICRASSRQFDNIHGSHGKARAINHTSHSAIKFNVVKPVLCCLDLKPFQFIRIIEFLYIGMPEKGIIVKGHFGIQGNQTVISCNHQRVYFNQRSVFFHKNVKEPGY